jgi:diamine N-acetyltransferase
VDYGFHVTALRMIGQKVLEHNVAGILAYTRAGFKPTGRLRQSGYRLDEACDELIADAVKEYFPDPSAIRGMTTED